MSLDLTRWFEPIEEELIEPLAWIVCKRPAIGSLLTKKRGVGVRLVIF